MGLLDRVQDRHSEDGTPEPQRSLLARGKRQSAPAPASNQGLLEQLKLRAQERLLEKVDLARLEQAGYASLLDEITAVIGALIEEDGLILTAADRARLIDATTNEMLGLGPLEPLLQDNEISDILVNGHTQVWVERKGKLYRTAVRFHDEQHLMTIIRRIVSRVGRRIDEASPMVDARLPDGSRVNAVIPPLAIDGAGLSIRRFGAQPFHMEDLVRTGTLTPEMAEFMRIAVRARLNILVSGGTGSGKTTLLNCLSASIPQDERIVTIEDAAELALQQPDVFRLETRPPNIEGKGEVTQRDLFRNTLRMRPDRIIVGEVRGAEVLDMLQAMSTGHDGSMATIHANSPRDSLGRLAVMMMLSGLALPEKAIRQFIAAALNLIVHVARLSDGSRRVVRISEITGLESDVVLTQDLFEFEQLGIGPGGKVLGRFRPTAAASVFARRFEAAGLPLDPRLFQAGQD